MNLSGLLPALRALPEYRTALDQLRSGGRPRGGVALGLQRSARAPVIAALSEDIRRPLLVACARADRAATLVEEIGAWTRSCRVLQFSEPNPLFYEYEPWSPVTIRARLAVLAALTQSSDTGPMLVVASARALMSRTLPRREFLANSGSLRAGDPVRLDKLLEAWVGSGYSAASIVVEPGQFARRGGILDIFPAADDLPVRIELFGDEIETIRHFDPSTQRSGRPTENATITPAREALPRSWKPDNGGGVAAGEASSAERLAFLEFQLPLMFPPASLLEYLPHDSPVLVDDWNELGDTVSEFEEQAVELRREQVEAGIISESFPVPYHSWPDLQDELATREAARVFLSAPDIEPDVGPTHRLGEQFHPGSRFAGQLKPLLDHVGGLISGGDRVVLVTRQAQRLAELWGELHPYLAPIENLTALPAEGTLVFIQGALAEGWRLDIPTALSVPSGSPPATSNVSSPSSLLHLLTDSEIFGWGKPEARRRARPVALAPEADYADLAPGDYVVHVDFGIGRFRELARREVEGLEREYLLIEYAGGDELYVPIHQADRLTRYVGVDERPPALSRLGSADWHSAKAKTQIAVEAVAKDLLELYARRETVEGHRFSSDSAWQSELEASFPYVETEDQLRALREVKADMEGLRPMDRLICGDVGYGKTEVALRAAFKAVMDGVQVAALVPTTVLAQQHLHTFRARLASYPVEVEMLSRFRSRAEAEDIIARLAEGRVDIVIGTHRLLQKDVRFKNLGLVIIDEEQRFGVTHKEHLKKLRTEVDVLTLTATPIPRTLYMSLTGVRDISTINTPPEERLPIVTHTGPYQERLVRQAILRELDRDGQVFFVHNRVQTIGAIRKQLERLVPEARIGVGHGQLDERELSRVMEQFTAGEIDVLLCTSIIESGLDIPNANTLIVHRADTFGLAQLYQLRGRVGRGAAQAYAHFFTDRRHRPTPEGRQRLETIAEQTELGAGYGIAMRDLEMRGAGDILGVRQHGHIAAVGFHLYTRLLGHAVQRLRSAAPGPTAEAVRQAPELSTLDFALISVDLPIPAFLPADYVVDRELRLRLYRRLAAVKQEDELREMTTEFADRFGPLPRPVENLLYQMRVKLRAGRAGVSAITGENGQIVLTVPPLGETERAYLAAILGAHARVGKSKIWLGPPPADDHDGRDSWRDALLELLARLEAEHGVHAIHRAGEAASSGVT